MGYELYVIPFLPLFPMRRVWQRRGKKKMRRNMKDKKEGKRKG